nr:hypothetical protein Iba_chr03bCG4050 [Ipomoea batatas]
MCLNVGEPLPLSPLVTATHIGIPPTGEHHSRTLAVTTIVAPVSVQPHPPSALEVTTVGSLAAPSSCGPALSPRTSHLASAPSSPMFANQSPVSLAALNSSMVVDLQEPPRSERISPSVEAVCSEETVEAVRPVHATGSMPAPSTQAGSLLASSTLADSMQDGDSSATVATGQATADARKSLESSAIEITCTPPPPLFPGWIGAAGFGAGGGGLAGIMVGFFGSDGFGDGGGDFASLPNSPELKLEGIMVGFFGSDGFGDGGGDFASLPNSPELKEVNVSM